MDKWNLIHSYMKNKDVPALLCPDDEGHLYVVDREGDPALRCMVCQSVYIPGRDVWDAIERNLDDPAA